MCHYLIEASSPLVCKIESEVSLSVQQDMEVGERMPLTDDEDQQPLDDESKLPLQDDDYPYQNGRCAASFLILESEILDQIRNEIVDLSIQLHDLQQILDHLDHSQVYYKHTLKLLPNLHSHKLFNTQCATRLLGQLL